MRLDILISISKSKTSKKSSRKIHKLSELGICLLDPVKQIYSSQMALEFFKNSDADSFSDKITHDQTNSYFRILSMEQTAAEFLKNSSQSSYRNSTQKSSRFCLHLVVLALRAFWFLEKTVLRENRVSGTLLMFQLKRNSPGIGNLSFGSRETDGFGILQKF